MRGGWHLLAHSSEVDEPGAFVMLPWMTGGEVVVTNLDGQIVAFRNACPHRGARLYRQTVGSQPPVCAYHGRCASEDTLDLLPVTFLGSWVLVADHPRAPPLGDVLRWLSGPVRDLLLAELPLRRHTVLELPYRCHWTVAVENALDFEHIVAVHPDSLGVMGLKVSESHTDPVTASSAHVFRSSEARRLSGMARSFTRPLDFDYAHVYLAPYSCVSSTRGYTVSLQQYFPRADGTTAFIHRMFEAEHRGDLSQFFRSAAAMNERVFREDAEICAHVPAYHDSRLGPWDARIQHFRNYTPGFPL